MKSHSTTAAALLLSVTAIAPCRAAGPAHDRMLGELRSVRAETLAGNPYQGAAEAERLRAELASLPAAASVQERARLNFDLGVAELFLGEEAAAIARLSEAERLLAGRSASSDFRNAVGMRLALAYLRLGETENCCLRHSPDSCLLPIRGGGVHLKQEGSRQAIIRLERILASSPESATALRLEARWLLNIASMTVGEYPSGVPPEYLIPPSAFDSEAEFPRFTNIGPALGVGTFSLSGGAVADDFDNDGLLDLVVSTSDIEGQLRFLRNRSGSLRTKRKQRS